VTNDADVRGRPTEVQQRIRLRLAIGAEDMGFAARDEDEVTALHAQLLPALEGEGGCSTAQVVEHRVRERRQRQTPGHAELIVKEERPAEADAGQYVAEDVHAGACYDLGRSGTIFGRFDPIVRFAPAVGSRRLKRS